MTPNGASGSRSEGSVIILKSKEGHGSWSTIELGAESVVYPGDDWTVAQSNLFEDLTVHLGQLFGEQTNGTSKPASNGAAATNGQTREHWCDNHGEEWTAKSGKNGATFYSHKQGDGWCNEPKERAA